MNKLAKKIIVFGLMLIMIMGLSMSINQGTTFADTSQDQIMQCLAKKANLQLLGGARADLNKAHE